MSGRALPILAYHAIDRSGAVTATGPDWFARTLRTHRDAGFRAIDLCDWVARGRPAEDRTFAPTFDDGDRSILHAAEVFAPFSVTATAFLVTGRMGLDNAWPGQPRAITRSPLLSWVEVGNLLSAGFRN